MTQPMTQSMTEATAPARGDSARAVAPAGPKPEWIAICRYDDLLPERGVCALVSGRQVALFRLNDGSLHALANYDPCSRAHVLSRGIVGSRGDIPIVASPMFKQVFDLRTGACLDDGSRSVPVFDVRVRNGAVEVRVPAGPP